MTPAGPGRGPFAVNDERRAMVRRTIIGFVFGAIVFGTLGMWMNTQIGASWFSNPGPVGILALIGGTTSGLVSPMFRRRRRPKD